MKELPEEQLSLRVLVWSRDWTQVSCIAGRFFTDWATMEAPNSNI